MKNCICFTFTRFYFSSQKFLIVYWITIKLFINTIAEIVPDFIVFFQQFIIFYQKDIYLVLLA